MVYIAKVVVSIFLALLVPSIAPPGDYITNAAQALQHASVYVAPDTEGTNSTTVSQLQAVLNADDNIVLVMLPATAEVKLGVDATTIVSSLSEKLGNRRIIGLAVGNTVVGYAPTLPSGVATDQMSRAESVSNDPVTALITFTQNIHQWQKDNPQPLPSHPTPDSNNGLGGVVWVFVLMLGIIAATFTIRYGRVNRARIERMHFNTPHQVENLLAKIMQERIQVNDAELSGALYQLCLDIEKYFQPSSGSEEDIRFFTDSLTKVIDVLAKYIDAQQNPRYYNEPRKVLESGKASIVDFSQSVLESIRRGNDITLRDYEVNTHILTIQRSINKMLDL